MGLATAPKLHLKGRDQLAFQSYVDTRGYADGGGGKSKINLILFSFWKSCAFDLELATASIASYSRAHLCMVRTRGDFLIEKEKISPINKVAQLPSCPGGRLAEKVNESDSEL